MEHLFGIVANFKNEFKYLFEWIVFHNCQGATYFRLYDNNSDDESYELIKILQKFYKIEHIVWKTPFSVSAQCQIYTQALRDLDGKVEFVSMIDIDEFVGITDLETGNLSTFLSNLPQEVSAISMHQRMYASSFQEKFLPDLVISRFIRTAPLNSSEHYWTKVTCRTSKVNYFASPHSVRIFSGDYILPDKTLVKPEQTGIVEKLSDSSFRFHHYIVKSKEEFFEKQKRWNYGESTGNDLDDKQRYHENYFYSREKEYNSEIDLSFYKLSEKVKNRMIEIFLLMEEGDIKNKLRYCYQFLQNI